METTGDIKCESCGDKPREKGRKLCSACRKQLQRNKTLADLAKDLPGKILKVEPKLKIPKTEKGHWFGKEPHRAIWTSCEAQNCPQMHNEEPDWEVTCERACCA